MARSLIKFSDFNIIVINSNSTLLNNKLSKNDNKSDHDKKSTQIEIQPL